jgi:hypothetical protein
MQSERLQRPIVKQRVDRKEEALIIDKSYRSEVTTGAKFISFLTNPFMNPCMHPSQEPTVPNML